MKQKVKELPESIANAIHSTPRTDKILDLYDMDPEKKILIEHARQLERELNIAYNYTERELNIADLYIQKLKSEWKAAQKTIRNLNKKL